MKLSQLIFCVLLLSCNKETPVVGTESIHSIIDNRIAGEPLQIEISKNEKLSIYIESDFLNKHNEGNTLLYGGVYSDLYDDFGAKTSEMYSDTAIIFNNSDSMKAKGNVKIESVNQNNLFGINMRNKEKAA